MKNITRHIKVSFKLWKSKHRLIPNFCKHCGIDIRDYITPDEVWKIIDPHIRNGHALCYQCFVDLCIELGINSIWKLSPLEESSTKCHTK